MNYHIRCWLEDHEPLILTLVAVSILAGIGCLVVAHGRKEAVCAKAGFTSAVTLGGAYYCKRVVNATEVIVPAATLETGGK